MFLKFGSEKNIKDLYENGTIFMNSREYFRKLEDKGLRGDSFEGIKEIKNYPPGEFKIPGIDRSFNHLGIHVPIYFKEVWGNIYCLFCIAPKTIPNPFAYKIDHRLCEFGTHCFLLQDIKGFIELLKNKMDSMGLKYSYDFVEYIDPKKITGQVSVFHKSLGFEYQKEFRVYIERDASDPVVFQLGSLEKFGQLFTSEQMMTLEFIPDPDNESMETITL